MLEAASAAGWYELAGQLAYDICRRVYGENDRRDLKKFERPMPGVAREYWPSDLSTWNASEGYGWGATTTSFVIRQLCGFYEAEEPSGCAFRLAPTFPRELIEGRRLGLGSLRYRGRLLRLAYQAVRDGEISIEVRLNEAARLRVQDEQSGAAVLDAPRSLSHVFELARGRPAQAELID